MRWSLVDARLDNGENDGNTVPLVPAAQGTLSGWFLPCDALRLGADCRYVSEQYQGNDEANALRKIGAYTLVGLTAQWRVSDLATLEAGVENLLNKTYASSAYSGGFYPGRGRVFHAGIRIYY
jgi:outer membrane receptor protein involved in Fe transport